MLYFVLTTLALLFACLSATDEDSVKALIASHDELRSLLDEIKATSSRSGSRSSGSGSGSDDSSRKSKRRSSLEAKKQKFEEKTRQILRRADKAVYTLLNEEYGDLVETIKPITSQRSLNSFVKDAKSSILKFENEEFEKYLESRYEAYLDITRTVLKGDKKHMEYMSLPGDISTVAAILSEYLDYRESDPYKARAFLDRASEKLKQLDQIYELQALLSELPMVSGWQRGKARMISEIQKEILKLNLVNFDPKKIEELKKDLQDVKDWDDVKEPKKYAHRY